MPSVFPFFEAGDPPPPFPIPTCQTNLADFAPPVVLIAHTILSPRPATRRKPIIRVAAPPDPRRSSTPVARAPPNLCRSSTPATRALPNPRRPPTPSARAPGRPPASIQGQFIPEPATLASISEDDTVSDLTSISSLPSNRSSPDPGPDPAPAPGGLIRKPEGEVSRPGRGGYRLDRAVGLSSRTFRAIRKHVQDLCDRHLDTSKSIKSQNTNRLREVRDEAIREFPELERYEECWPVDDMVLLYLKTTARRATLKKEAAAKGQGKRA